MSDRSPDSPVGLVLSGGGALGAYEAGVWKAFCECGVANRVRAISGTSVGVINGAAFALLHDPEEMRNLWVNRVREILTPNFKLFDRGKIAGTIGNAFHGRQAFPFLGIFSREGLSAILRDVIARPVAETGIDVYATALQCKGSIWRMFDPTAYCLRRFHLNEERPVERMRQIIMASAAVPWGFDPVEIDGERYVDGGFEANGGDNVPIAPILDNHPEIKTVYVVRFESRRTEPNVKTVHSESGRKIIEIRPRDPLPGVLDGWNFANNPIANTPVIQRAVHGIVAKFPIYSGAISFLPEYSEKYFDTGYADGMAVLRDSQLQQEFIWRNKAMAEDKQASASTQKQGQDIAPTQSLRWGDYAKTLRETINSNKPVEDKAKEVADVTIETLADEVKDRTKTVISISATVAGLAGDVIKKIADSKVKQTPEGSRRSTGADVPKDSGVANA